MIGERELALMRPGAVLVNVSRGPVLVERALADALRAGRIAAGLDVFDEEPIRGGHPFTALPNVVLTPHIASAGRRTRAAMAALAVTTSSPWPPASARRPRGGVGRVPVALGSAFRCVAFPNFTQPGAGARITISHEPLRASPRPSAAIAVPPPPRARGHRGRRPPQQPARRHDRPRRQHLRRPGRQGRPTCFGEARSRPARLLELHHAATPTAPPPGSSPGCFGRRARRQLHHRRDGVSVTANGTIYIAMTARRLHAHRPLSKRRATRPADPKSPGRELNPVSTSTS